MLQIAKECRFDICIINIHCIKYTVNNWCSIVAGNIYFVNNSYICNVWPPYYNSPTIMVVSKLLPSFIINITIEKVVGA